MFADKFIENKICTKILNRKVSKKNLKPNIREQKFEMKKFGKKPRNKYLNAKNWRKFWETKIRDSGLKILNKKYQENKLEKN